MKKKDLLVFMDVSIDGDPAERMVFELFPEVAPKTAENFRALCTGEKGIGQKTGRPLHFKGSFFHRIIRGSMAQGGDFHKRDGTSGESIYGEKFPDESPRLKHDGPGLLSMLVADRDALGSHFLITFKADHHLDRKSVVFGKLVQGLEVLKRIENAGDDEGRPTVTVKIINCGEFSEDKKRANKLKMGKDTASEANSHEPRRKSKRKKSSRDRRKKRRRYSSSSESSTDIDSESSETESESDSYDSSSSYVSSSSDDRRKRRKRSSKRDKSKRGKRRDKRRDRKRKRRDKRSKRRSRRVLNGSSDTGSETESGSNSEDDSLDAFGKDRKKKDPSQNSGPGLSTESIQREGSDHHKKRESAKSHGNEADASLKVNGDRRSNGIEDDAHSNGSPDRRPDVVDDHPGKSRSRSRSRSMSPSSISPHKNMSKSPDASLKRAISRSPSVPSRSPSPRGGSGRSRTWRSCGSRGANR